MIPLASTKYHDRSDSDGENWKMCSVPTDLSTDLYCRGKVDDCGDNVTDEP